MTPPRSFLYLFLPFLLLCKAGQAASAPASSGACGSMQSQAISKLNYLKDWQQAPSRRCANAIDQQLCLRTHSDIETAVDNLKTKITSACQKAQQVGNSSGDNCAASGSSSCLSGEAATLRTAAKEFRDIETETRRIAGEMANLKSQNAQTTGSYAAAPSNSNTSTIRLATEGLTDGVDPKNLREETYRELETTDYRAAVQLYSVANAQETRQAMDNFSSDFSSRAQALEGRAAELEKRAGSMSSISGSGNPSRLGGMPMPSIPSLGSGSPQSQGSSLAATGASSPSKEISGSSSPPSSPLVTPEKPRDSTAELPRKPAEQRPFSGAPTPASRLSSSRTPSAPEKNNSRRGAGESSAVKGRVSGTSHEVDYGEDFAGKNSGSCQGEKCAAAAAEEKEGSFSALAGGIFAGGKEEVEKSGAEFAASSSPLTEEEARRLSMGESDKTASSPEFVETEGSLFSRIKDRYVRAQMKGLVQRSRGRL